VGDLECSIGNAGITGVTVLPAYYDGALQVLEVDGEGCPLKGHRTRNGSKIWIDSLSLHDCFDYSGFVIEYETEEDRKRYEKADSEARHKDNQINWRVERDSFTEWVFLKIQAIRPITPGWVERLTQAANEFYTKHRGPDIDGEAIKARDWGWNKGSYRDRLFDLWEELISVDWDNYSRILITFKESKD
jgi:hypothetical protein